MKFVLLSLVFSTLAISHSGRTNSSGCHNDNIHGGYHCHKSDDFKSKRNPASTKKETKKKDSKKKGNYDV